MPVKSVPWHLQVLESRCWVGIWNRTVLVVLNLHLTGKFPEQNLWSKCLCVWTSRAVQNVVLQGVLEMCCQATMEKHKICLNLLLRGVSQSGVAHPTCWWIQHSKPRSAAKLQNITVRLLWEMWPNETPLLSVSGYSRAVTQEGKAVWFRRASSQQSQLKACCECICEEEISTAILLLCKWLSSETVGELVMQSLS